MSNWLIVPKTHLIKSIRSRTGLSLDGALHEFCDNSIGHGHAETIYITIDREQITVKDDGSGADNAVRLFTLGDASDYGNLSNIGQYGIGATDSAIFLGDTLRVTSIRAGRVQEGKANWKKVEESGKWEVDGTERAFAEADLRDFPNTQGVKIVISALQRRWMTASAVKLAEHLGLVFMPAIRAGTRIHLTHMDREGVKLNEWVAAYEPPKLHDEIQIAGVIESREGVIGWTGRAGLSHELTSKENAVLITFGHRVIERTDEPFLGESAPTLYAEVELSQNDGAKYLLSDKKDRIVRHRDELMGSINFALADLIKKAHEEGEHLILASIMLPIQERVTRALQGVGLLVIDPDEEGEPVSQGEGSATGNGRLKPITDEGVAAKERPPTGVRVEWATLDKLNRAPYAVTLSHYSVVVKLAREYYEGIIQWPPKQRDQRIVELIVGMVARGVEIEYVTGNLEVLNVLKPKLRRRVEQWAEEKEIAPRLTAELQARVAREEAT